MFHLVFDSVEKWIEKIMNFELLSEVDVIDLCELSCQENILKYITLPITIVGNLNGQFNDLIEIFKINGKLPDINYLFLGNYCTLGNCSVEVLTLLLALKVKYPTRITLLRGNTEDYSVSYVKGLYDEILKKYKNLTVWRSLVDLFDYFPLCSVIEKDIFCVHGGLSPYFSTFDDILRLDRIESIPHEGIKSDILWSDPDIKLGWNMSNRGAAYLFGPDITEIFFHKNNLNMMIRSHGLCMEGFKWHHTDQLQEQDVFRAK